MVAQMAAWPDAPTGSPQPAASRDGGAGWPLPNSPSLRGAAELRGNPRRLTAERGDRAWLLQMARGRWMRPTGSPRHRGLAMTGEGAGQPHREPVIARPQAGNPGRRCRAAQPQVTPRLHTTSPHRRSSPPGLARRLLLTAVLPVAGARPGRCCRPPTRPSFAPDSAARHAGVPGHDAGHVWRGTPTAGA